MADNETPIDAENATPQTLNKVPTVKDTHFSPKKKDGKHKHKHKHKKHKHKKKDKDKEKENDDEEDGKAIDEIKTPQKPPEEPLDETTTKAGTDTTDPKNNPPSESTSPKPEAPATPPGSQKVKKSKKASPFGGLKKQPKKDDNDEDEDEGEGDAKAGTDKIDKKSKNIVGEFELEGSDEDDGFDAEKEAKRLRKLERKIERDKKEFQNLKTLVEKSHRVKLDRKAAQHETNIKKLDSIIKDNRKVITETVTELDSLHKSELEAKLMEAQFQKEIWELEQDVQLDKIILEKMELKKVQERIKVLEDLQMDRLASLEAVEDERKRRTYEQENKLEILLGKIPHLTTGLEESEIKNTFDAKKIMGEYGAENEDAVYRAGDASKKIREEKYKVMVAEMQKERVEWVEEKAKLEKDMAKLEEERRKAVRRLRKGKDWLVKVELGEEEGEVGGEEGDDVEKVDVFEGLEEEDGEKKKEEDKKDEEENKDEEKKDGGSDDKKVADAAPDADAKKDPDAAPETILPPKPQEPTYEELEYKALLKSFYEKYAPGKVKEVAKTLSKKKPPADLDKEFARLAKKYNCDDPLVEAKGGLAEKVKKQKDGWEKEVKDWEEEVKKIKDAKKKDDKEREEKDKDDEIKENSEGDVSKDASGEGSKPIVPPIPPHLLEVTSKVALQIPLSSTHVTTLQAEIAALEKEFDWVEGDKAKAWEDAQGRLEKLSIKEVSRLKRGFKAELASFAHVSEGREIRARGEKKEREIMKCSIDIVEESVKGFIKGIYNEMLGVNRFTEGKAKDAILFALGVNNGGTGEEWERSMWGRCYDQIVKERKKRDHTIKGEMGVRRIQRLRHHFIDGKVAQKEAKRVKYDDLKIPSVEQWGKQSVRVDRRTSSPQFKQLETEYWDSVQIKSNKIKIMNGVGGVSAVATGGYREWGSSGGWNESCMIAVGTTKGAVLIYRMTKRDAVPTLIRSMNVLPTKLKKPVLDMSFGYDSTSQLVTLNEGTTRDSRIVRLWSISVQPDLKDPTIHSRDAFGSFAPTLPAVSLQIDGEDGVKVGYVDRRMKKEMLDAWNEEESNSGIFGGKSKKIKEKEQREMKLIYAHEFPPSSFEPNSVGLHGSMTMLGIQPSVLVGTKGGCVYKWNNVEATGTSKSQRGIVTTEKIVVGESKADTEPGNPKNKIETLREIKVIGKKDGGVVRREFFEFHKSPVVFVCEFSSGSYAGFVSVDNSGGCARWVERQDLWSSHGWWDPESATMWDLTVGGEPGSIVECKKAEGRREVLVMARYREGKLRVFVWNVDKGRFLRQYVEHDGGTRAGVEPSFDIFPVFSSLGSDYIAITVDGRVSVYSISTGQEIKRGAFGREINGNLLGCSVGMRGEIVVYSTPDSVRHVVYDGIDFGSAEGEGGAELRRNLGEAGRGRRQGCCGVEMMAGWKGGTGYREWCKDWVVERAGKAVEESEERRRKEEGGKVEIKEVEEDDGEEGWLGEGDLGTVEPKRLGDLPKEDK